MTDAELLRGARQGSAEAWRTLYGRYLPAVWRQAYALVPDVHTAEDVTSETMLALLRNIGQLDLDEPRVGGWLRSVVRRKAADHFRKAFRTPSAAGLPLGASLSDAAEAGPAALLETDETRRHVLRVLGELPDRQRTVLEWKYLESLRVREIAERLGETEKAVEAVLYRARREFRRLFESGPVPAVEETRDGQSDSANPKST